MVNSFLKYLVSKLYPYWSSLYYLANFKNKNAVMYPNAFLMKRIFIDPNKVSFYTSLPVKPKKGTLYFLPGNWDENLPEFDYKTSSNFKYKTAYEILKHNTPLSKTSEYKHVDEIIKKTGNYRGYSDTLEYMNTIKSLYNSIINNGYVTRRKLLNNWVGEVEFALGRSGRLIKINSGNHRFSCSRILNIKKIPINVCVIHDDYYSEFEEGGFKAINKLLHDVETEYK